MTHPNAGLHLTGICLVTINLTLIIMLSIVHCSYIVALTATVTTTDTDLQLGLNNYQSMGPMSERTPARNSLRDHCVLSTTLWLILLLTVTVNYVVTYN